MLKDSSECRLLDEDKRHAIRITLIPLKTPGFDVLACFGAFAIL
jgi:hypothetical protein